MARRCAAAGGPTTSDVVSVHRQLATLRAGGAAAVAMEVSSHALDQGRVDAVRFEAAAFTNLTQDHLDYHGTLQAYGAAKAQLFTRPTLTARIINIDDAFGRELALTPGAPGRLVVTARAAAPQAQAHVIATRVQAGNAGLDLTLSSSWGDARLSVSLLGEFNVDNVLTTLAVLLAAQIPLASALDALAHCVAAPGRMQRVAAAGSAARARSSWTMPIRRTHWRRRWQPPGRTVAVACIWCSAAAATGTPRSGPSWGASP